MSDDSLDHVLLNALRSVTGTQSCLYAAGPITTSREYFIALATGASNEKDVTLKRREELAHFAATLRRSTGEVVIDPSLLQVPGWGGSDYSRFFLQVIAQLCRQVWILDGWEYSYGVTQEVVLAMELRIPVMDSAGEVVEIARAIGQISLATSDLQELGVDTAKLECRLDSLKRILLTAN